MNDAVTQLYQEHLQQTGFDTSAAASLTLADVMQSARDDQSGRHNHLPPWLSEC